MPDIPQNKLAQMTEWGPSGMPGAVSATGERPRRRFAACAVGLAVAGVLPPIAVTLAAAANALAWRPLSAGTLAAALVLLPAAVGLTAALVAPHRIVPPAGADGEVESAVARVFVATGLFGYGLALSSRALVVGGQPDCLAAASVGLVGAWALLLCILLWPAALAVRRHMASAFEAGVLSAFLHFGGGAASGCYPLYLAAILYGGFRFGIAALLITTAVSAIGFAAVILTTEAWLRQPGLAAGLFAAILLLPAFAFAGIRGTARARAAAADAEAVRQRTLSMISERLREPGFRAGESAAPFSEIIDLAEIESGSFDPPVEAFDLRPLVNRILVPLQAGAAAKGIPLRWRINPRLPPRLRGRVEALARILGALAHHAIEVAPASAVTVTIDAAEAETFSVTLRLRVDGIDRQQGTAAGETPLALRLVQRLAALAAGSAGFERMAGRRFRVTVTLPLGIEDGGAGSAPDLSHRPVLIATEDETMARELAEPLTGWGADAYWPGNSDAAIEELARPRPGERPILMIDGREKLLAALSLAHRAVRLEAAPFVVLIADAAQIASLEQVDEGGIDAFVPAPPDASLLANALDALPLVSPQAPPERIAATRELKRQAPGRVTPIASHPKFAAEPPVVDPRAIERLRALGGGAGFLREVIDTFRTDADQILARIEQAVADGDTAAFTKGVVALHRAASQLGGTQLCDLLGLLQNTPPTESRQHGAAQVQRIRAEIDLLSAALLDLPARAEAGRS